MVVTPTTQTILGELGQAIPDTPHAVSVSLPTWKANVGYEEGEEWVLSKMKNGYPRFFIHVGIQAFAEVVARKYGNSEEQAMLFPSTAAATRCIEFLARNTTQKSTIFQSLTTGPKDHLRIVDLVFQHKAPVPKVTGTSKTIISAVIFARSEFKHAKTFWQHSGEGVSSRRAEFCFKAFEEGYLVPRNPVRPESIRSDRMCKGPRRYQRKSSLGQTDEPVSVSMTEDPNPARLTSLDRQDYAQFVEERFGRNLDLSLAANAKLAVRRRIAGSLTADVDLKEAIVMPSEGPAVRKVQGFSENDIYLYPCGMNSIFNTHRIMLKARGSLKSISFGFDLLGATYIFMELTKHSFPYIDTLKILEKWGPGCLFYGHGSSADLDDLENRCKSGEKFLSLFCEFPGNPLLKSPDLRRIRKLADQYDFAVVVDETIGNFMNVHILPAADVVVSSLTKVFSGDSNVMGGSSILNPRSRYYHQLRRTMTDEYEDNYWPEDAIYLERNSRDFVSRIDRINKNAEAICQILKASPYVKEIYYPKYSPTRPFYDDFRHPTGGYGGLLSVTFHTTVEAVTFFDVLEVAKGPSLGTNFTLCSPYVILAHYNELDWAAQFGVEADLIRISVGLEDSEELKEKCERALAAVAGLGNTMS
ncbi:hypothetical protein MMC18_003705 [Xylographa bjoerkii]|nr:hypothetical protein [Xylographa bjoerkii]